MCSSALAHVGCKVPNALTWLVNVTSSLFFVLSIFIHTLIIVLYFHICLIFILSKPPMEEPVTVAEDCDCSGGCDCVPVTALPTEMLFGNHLGAKLFF